MKGVILHQVPSRCKLREMSMSFSESRMLTRRQMLLQAGQIALASRALSCSDAGTAESMAAGKSGPMRLGFRVRLDVVTEGYDRRTDWFQPRIGIIPPRTAVLTMTKAQLWGSDIFTAVQEMRSDDFGRTWSGPKVHATLGRRKLSGDAEACPCDLTPAWHAKTGKLLMTGQIGRAHV
jgi:hypothetical protein